ncbi:kynureninase [Blastococcus sp. VKM Ac-2987]|uniref:kynureninase n=1 Tax=Blastococcus sp. VKM Ac-2987 TaxID=3004141 RepID=UPI0022ABB54C|nr:kynureninase [Blastococcus sp. VKM Ac-2987]MCZ2857583.1 kynureninase [Blastococcus sp. VKM Ac-2987]
MTETVTARPDGRDLLADLLAREEQALALDAADELPTRRAEFHVPPAEGGDHPETAYFAGNSLGLRPRRTSVELLEDMDDWAQWGVEGHTEARRPWLPYHAFLREPMARLVGAKPDEVVAMNSLTVNLHLLMVSFYRPEGARRKILIEDSAFPSDSYAVRSQAAFHGLDPDAVVTRMRPREGEESLRTEDVVDLLRRSGHEHALVLFGGVNYLTGELLDMPAITRAGHEAGCVVGWDLAHAAGNVPLALHEWDVDFAAWCTYKYLNSGAGAVAGVFVHERHLAGDRPRFEGWWTTRESTRFEMAPVADPPPTADAWALSNPPIFAMGPVRSSLEMFDETGMPALRARSLRLTAYLESLFDEVFRDRPLTQVTPRDPAARGSQLSVRIEGRTAKELTAALRVRHGVIADARQPDIVRFAPVPMYVTFHDCWRAAVALAREVAPR